MLQQLLSAACLAKTLLAVPLTFLLVGCALDRERSAMLNQMRDASPIFSKRIGSHDFQHRGKMSYLKEPLISLRSPPMSRTSSQDPSQDSCLERTCTVHTSYLESAFVMEIQPRDRGKICLLRGGRQEPELVIREDRSEAECQLVRSSQHQLLTCFDTLIGFENRSVFQDSLRSEVDDLHDFTKEFIERGYHAEFGALRQVNFTATRMAGCFVHRFVCPEVLQLERQLFEVEKLGELSVSIKLASLVYHIVCTSTFPLCVETCLRTGRQQGSKRRKRGVDPPEEQAIMAIRDMQ